MLIKFINTEDDVCLGLAASNEFPLPRIGEHVELDSGKFIDKYLVTMVTYYTRSNKIEVSVKLI